MSARQMNAHPSTEPISQIIRVRLTEEATSWGHRGSPGDTPVVAQEHADQASPPLAAAGEVYSEITACKKQRQTESCSNSLTRVPGQWKQYFHLT